MWDQYDVRARLASGSTRYFCAFPCLGSARAYLESIGATIIRQEATGTCYECAMGYPDDHFPSEGCTSSVPTAHCRCDACRAVRPHLDAPAQIGGEWRLSESTISGLEAWVPTASGGSRLRGDRRSTRPTRPRSRRRQPSPLSAEAITEARLNSMVATLAIGLGQSPSRFEVTTYPTLEYGMTRVRIRDLDLNRVWECSFNDYYLDSTSNNDLVRLGRRLQEGVRQLLREAEYLSNPLLR